MNAPWLLMALVLSSQAGTADKKEELYPFTLDQIAAGAKNDAFVDEFLEGKSLQLFGTVKQIERTVDFDGKKDPGYYRLVIERLGREEAAVDVSAAFFFTAADRKELAMLEPGISKVAIEGKCHSTQMQSLESGLHFTLNLKDCKVVETPQEFLPPTGPPQRPQVIPNVTPEGATTPNGKLPYIEGLTIPGLPGRIVPGAPLPRNPPLPQDPNAPPPRQR